MRDKARHDTRRLQRKHYWPPGIKRQLPNALLQPNYAALALRMGGRDFETGLANLKAAAEQ
jgi:hypothetical protein